MEASLDPKDIEVFVEIAKQMSVSKAATVLGLPNSHVSRRLKSLESSLGIRLVHRTTRRFELTELGKNYADQCALAFGQLSAAKDYVESFKGEPQGLLRVMVPFELGFFLCQKFFMSYTSRFPKIKLDVVCKNKPTLQDFSSHDVVIEVGHVMAPQSYFQKRVLHTFRRLYATPFYLEKHPIRSIDDIQNNQIIELISERETGPATDALFINKKTDEKRMFQLQSQLRINSLTGAKKLALQNYGLCFVAAFMCQNECESGQLVHVLEDWQSPPIDIFASVDTNKRSSPKVITFLRAIEEVQFGEPLGFVQGAQISTV